MIFLELPADCSLVELPSLASRRGSARLAVAARTLGEPAALAAARAAGPYLLEDSLVASLRLAGLELPADGELRALSPPRWRAGHSERSGMRDLSFEAEICGLLLTPAEKKALLAFTGAVADPTRLLALAAHFFYEQDLKVVTRPRVSNP